MQQVDTGFNDKVNWKSRFKLAHAEFAVSYYLRRHILQLVGVHGRLEKNEKIENDMYTNTLSIKEYF